ncbi:MAG: hypothetical protein K8I27_17060 [Planctomycetes bacterium]|nr:hypothetical protein [Planctomycetota bacterium]
MNERSVKLPSPRPEPTAADLVTQREYLVHRAGRFRLYVLGCMIAGVVVSAVFSVVFRLQEGTISIWFLPIFLISVLGGVGLLKVKWNAELAIEAIDIGIRKLERNSRA